MKYSSENEKTKLKAELEGTGNEIGDDVTHDTFFLSFFLSFVRSFVNSFILSFFLLKTLGLIFPLLVLIALGVAELLPPQMLAWLLV